LSEKRSERVREWARYKVRMGKCREQSCNVEIVSETPEGRLCLEHYCRLPSCVECGKAASGGARLCAECEKKRDEALGMTSSLSYHEEVSGHDTIGMGGMNQMRRRMWGTNPDGSKKKKKAS